RDPGSAVALVDQDQLLLGGPRCSPCPTLGPNADLPRHGFVACRKSFTRTALPCERGTSPGALSTTSQVTPTMFLRWARTSLAIFATNGSSRGAGGGSPTSILMASI